MITKIAVILLGLVALVNCEDDFMKELLTLYRSGAKASKADLKRC